jgi:molybdate transport system substrate-binding protein
MRRLLLTVGLLLCSFAGGANAATKILATRVVDGALRELKPQLESKLHDSVEIETATSPVILGRLAKGESADVVLLTKESVQQLSAVGQVADQADVAVALVAVAVADNAPTPILKTATDFRNFLLSTPSIAYTATGPSGIHMAMLLTRFDLQDTIKPKATIVQEGLTGTLLVQGRVASAVQQVSELRSAGARNIVLLPKEIQRRTVVTAATLQKSTAPGKGREILQFLRSAEAKAAYRRCGVDPL